MRERKPLILLTNDDGYRAEGINAIAEALAPMGRIVVVAPEGAQSGKSNAITVNRPIRVSTIEETSERAVYAVEGTPTDCVKLAVNELLGERPDLLVSGINHGPNGAISVIYSGTMGAALEGCVCGIPSVGLSLGSYKPNPDFAEAVRVSVDIIRKVLEEGLPEGVCLNVNIPEDKVKGIKICHQTRGKWIETFVKREDPTGRPYYWLSGYYVNYEKTDERADENARAQGWATVVPTRIDMTDYATLEALKHWEEDIKP